MKCVKNIENGEITRIYDERAEEMVRSKKFTYCPKSEWKKNKEKK
jgi:hypothetical protein